MTTTWTWVAVCTALAFLGPRALRESRPPDPALRPLPPPTEHWLAHSAESTQKQRRKAWIAERHRAPPGTDWQAIERGNGQAQVEKRNALARSGLRSASGGRWVERGSENQSGRIHAAARSPSSSALYAGSSLGGIWRGTLDGTDWAPLGDNLYGGAHWLAVVPGAEGDVILAATDGGLVHRSADDGATWDVPEGLPSFASVRRLATASDGTWTVYLLGVSWNGDASLYRSTDAAASFEEIYDLDDYQGDLWTPRDGGAALYLLYADELLRSDDHGDTWVLVGELDGDVTGGELAGSEAGADGSGGVPRLWAALDAGGDQLFRSDDGGATWVLVTPLTDYWNALTASIVDPDVFAWGGVELHRTDDAGASFAVVNRWDEYYGDPEGQLHADIMGVDVAPDEGGGETWYVATDGGLYLSSDGLLTVHNLSLRGLRVSQYYSTLTDVSRPDRVAAGSQDQGYQLTAGITQTNEVWDFDQALSGDYGHLTSAEGDHNFVFSVYPGFLLVQEDPEGLLLTYAYFPNDPAMAWLPPVVADPGKPRFAFFAGSRLWRFAPDGFSWTASLWSDQDFAVDYYEYISALTFSPLDDQRAWVATNYGRIHWSEDHGKTWTEAEGRGPDAQWLYGSALLASSTDPETVWVGGSGYGSPSVYRSQNGGKNWMVWDEGLPDTTVYCLCEAPDGSGTLFAGTETAAYRRDKGAGNEWVDITGAEAPVTIYWSCEALHDENTIRFGTYGRGIWDYQIDDQGVGCVTPVDRDGDGVDCDLDCDDDNAAVFPGAVDPCDGDPLDLNCDPEDPDESVGPDGRLRCEPAPAEAEGCACDTGTPGSNAVGFALIASLVRARRRRG